MLVISLALLGLACGGNDGLVVRGEVSVDIDGTPTGFVFERPTALLEADLAEPTDSRLRGSCRIARDEAGGDVVAMSIERAPGAREGVEIERFFVRAGSSTQVEARLGADRFAAGSRCDVALDYVIRRDAIAGVTFDCDLAGPAGATARATGELAFEGCTVD